MDFSVINFEVHTQLNNTCHTQIRRHAREGGMTISKNPTLSHYPAIPLFIHLLFQVTSDTQLTAALEFVKSNPVNPDQSRLEEACGVGVVITAEQIKTAVSAKVEANMAQIKTQRYRYVRKKQGMEK